MFLMDLKCSKRILELKNVVSENVHEKDNWTVSKFLGRFFLYADDSFSALVIFVIFAYLRDEKVHQFICSACVFICLVLQFIVWPRRIFINMKYLEPFTHAYFSAFSLLTSFWGISFKICWKIFFVRNIW